VSYLPKRNPGIGTARLGRIVVRRQGGGLHHVTDHCSCSQGWSEFESPRGRLRRDATLYKDDVCIKPEMLEDARAVVTFSKV
jgi:hypothetical protein